MATIGTFTAQSDGFTGSIKRKGLFEAQGAHADRGSGAGGWRWIDRPPLTALAR